jgi:hypothetical protein
MNTPPTVQAQVLIAPQLLIDSLETNYNVIQRQVKGLTHEDSLLQPPFRGNCLNWVMGHLIWRRDSMLQLLDEPTVWTKTQHARYERDSQPITSGDDAFRFEQIMADFGTAQERLVNTLKQRTAENLMEVQKELVPGAPPQSIAEWLHFLVWHETYHVGQTELLRQLTGVNDKVI